MGLHPMVSSSYWGGGVGQEAVFHHTAEVQRVEAEKDSLPASGELSLSSLSHLVRAWSWFMEAWVARAASVQAQRR